MIIKKELQMILDHLQPNIMNGSPLKVNPNNIKQLDKPPNSGEKKNVKIGKTGQTNKKYLLKHRKQPFELRGGIIMQSKLIPTATKAKQIKNNIGQGQNTTTYKLRARSDKERISQTSSRDKTQPHTN